MTTTRRLCLVTGASAGIGAALAREYAKQGWDIALTARRAERLRELQTEIENAFDVAALVFPADLSDPEAPARLIEQISSAGRQVDGLVNNAGYGLPGGFVSNGWSDHDRFLRLMLTAPTELCHRVLPGMQERGFGRIINVSSLAGHLPAGAGHTLYAGVKSYLIRTSEALNAETRGTGVHVTALCPGFTRTEFHDVNKTRDMVESAFPAFMWASAESVAQSGYAACEANVAVRVTEAPNKALAVIGKLLPDAVGRRLMRGQSPRYRDAR